MFCKSSIGICKNCNSTWPLAIARLLIHNTYLRAATITCMQQLFFHHIKERMPDHLSLVDEVAELLNMSNDSAYRRFAGIRH
jgi:hypothetical protein